MGLPRTTGSDRVTAANLEDNAQKAQSIAATTSLGRGAAASLLASAKRDLDTAAAMRAAGDPT